MKKLMAVVLLSAVSMWAQGAPATTPDKPAEHEHHMCKRDKDGKMACCDKQKDGKMADMECCKNGKCNREHKKEEKKS